MNADPSPHLQRSPDPDSSEHPSTQLVIDDLESLQEMVGQEFPIGAWLTITQENIQTFAEVTNDLQWIHLDTVRAQRESPFKATVAHGFFTLSLLSRFLSEAMQVKGKSLFVVNYGLDKVRFPAPLRVGEQIRCRFLLRSLAQVPGGHHAVYAVTVEIKDALKPCCVAEWLVRYYTSSS